MYKKDNNKGKHLTLEERMTILNELIKGTKLSDISNKISKDPTTISKEVKLHRYSKESNKAYKSTSCKQCTKFYNCKLASLCNKSNCKKYCKTCMEQNVNTICENFIEIECKVIKRFPYTCHNCRNKSSCKETKYFYDPTLAQKDYEDLLVESRKGINMSTSEFNELDSIISDGVRKGKSIYSIILNNSQITKSERTIYRYVGYNYLQVKDLDLRNKVKMKPRKSYKNALPNDKKILKKETINPRNYDAYLKFLADNRTCYIPQFDLVQGKKGEAEPYLMTFIFPFSNFMFAYLIPSKEQCEIVKVFNDLEDKLGLENFKRLFPACLTDRGNEFLDADGIENSKDGTKRTNLFYCNPYASCQKAEIERNHEFFRYYSPKGKSIKEYTQEEINLMFSHINSYNRKSRDDRTPYDIFEFVYGKEIIERLGIKKIDFEEIDLSRNLIINFRKK